MRSEYNTRSNPSDGSSTSGRTDAGDVTGIQRERVAWHESGHALAFLLVTGRPPELVSVRPGRAFCGITLGPREKTWSGEFEPKLLSIDQPSDLRHALEARIVVRLAGEAAAQLGVPPASGYQPLAPTSRQPRPRRGA